MSTRAKRKQNHPLVWKSGVLPETLEGIGAVAGTGVTVEEFGDGITHRTKFTFTDVAIALTDNPGVIAYGGLKFYDFPEGAIKIEHAAADLAITKSSAGVNADWDGDFSIGTVTASNNNTLSSTEANILPSTATPQAVSGATTAKGQAAAVAFLDGTAAAPDAYLNVLVDDTDHNVAGTACNLIFNGTVVIDWRNPLDY